MICLAIGIWVFALDLKKIFQIENFMISVIQIQRFFGVLGAGGRRGGKEGIPRFFTRLLCAKCFAYHVILHKAEIDLSGLLL